MNATMAARPHLTRIQRRDMERRATVSDDEVYRYDLARRWGDGLHVVWVMLNPSTADGKLDDPTIRRVINFTHAWGFDAIRVVNLYAFRATDPTELRKATARGVCVVGEQNGATNDEAIRYVMQDSGKGAALIVRAWGSTLMGDGSNCYTAQPHRAVFDRAQHRENSVSMLLTAQGSTRGIPVCELGHNQDTRPKHPLYLKGDTLPRTRSGFVPPLLAASLAHQPSSEQEKGGTP